MTAVEVPADLLALLQQSRLGERSQSDQIRVILAMHLAQAGVISVGRAAELAGEPRVTFELLMMDMGFSIVHYDEGDYEQDLRAIAHAS